MHADAVLTGPCQVLTVDPAAAEPHTLAPAATILRRGGLVAFPTETVYGLGADARSAVAVARVFAAKGRPADNPLIVHVGSLAAAERVVASVPPLAAALAGRWWPGPLTLVLQAAPGLAAATTGGLATVAVRVPDHPVALALLAAADLPVAAPSANRSGRPSPTTAAHVCADLGDTVDLVVDGGSCPVGVESTVVDARGSEPVVLREGSVTREQLGLGATAGGPGDPGASPGTRHRHYAPTCRVELAALGEGPARAATLAAAGETVGLVAGRAGEPPVVTLAVARGAADLARALYGALRAAEAAGVDVVVVEEVPDTGLGRAVMDRLRRAAAG